MTKSNILRKLTTAAIFGPKMKVLTAAMAGRKTDESPTGEPVALYDIGGIVRDIEGVDTEYGTSQKFRGQFVARNADGEEFSAPVCYLPDAAADLIAGAFPEGGELEFSMRILVSFDAASATSYVYSAQSHISQSGGDRVAALLDAAPNAIPTLPSPDQGKSKK